MLWRLTILGVLGTAIATAQSDTPQQILHRAIELQQAGRYAEAIADYRAFLKAYPEAAPVRSNLGAALAHQGAYNQAIQQYTLALKDAPSNYGIRFNLALAYYKTGDMAHAVPEFEAVYMALSKGDPNQRKVALLLAECYLRQGENQRVVALLNPLEPSNPNDLTLDYLLGVALLHEGKIKPGALLIRKLLEHGDAADAHMLMAYTRYEAHDKKGALVEVDKAIALNPDLPEAYSLRGRLEYLESNPKAAEAGFRKALELDPNNYDAHLWLGTLLREEGHLHGSKVNLERALQLQPKAIRARYQFARLCEDEGDNKHAAEVLESLVKDHPEYTEAHRTLATIYFRLGLTAEGRRERKLVERMDAAIQAKDIKEGRSLK